MWPFKKRSAVDSIKVVIRICDDVEKLKSSWTASFRSEEDSDAKKNLLLNRLRSLITIIQKATEEQIIQVKQETGSERLYNECLNVKNFIDKIDKNLDKLGIFEIVEIIEKVKQLEDHIYREIESTNLNLDKYELGSLLGSGGNSQTYEIKNHPELVLQTVGSVRGRGFGNKNDIDRFTELIQRSKKVPKKVNLARIIEVGWKNGYAAIVMQRAKGNTLYMRDCDYRTWSKSLELIARAPQRHYTKLVKDVNLLHKQELQVDPSKSDNFFYDQKYGFFIIDISLGKYIGSLQVPFLYTNRLWTYENELTNTDCINILNVINKLNTAGDNKFGSIKEKIYVLVRKKYPQLL